MRTTGSPADPTKRSRGFVGSVLAPPVRRIIIAVVAFHTTQSSQTHGNALKHGNEQRVPNTGGLSGLPDGPDGRSVGSRIERRGMEGTRSSHYCYKNATVNYAYKNENKTAINGNAIC
mmetsp:Transcript_18082/g.37963  ORF Transcript_18082/g.37963 Transcript_18082/m.37963 type:complete len:118 (+) Transcript_18082:930-1283(+)